MKGFLVICTLLLATQGFAARSVEGVFSGNVEYSRSDGNQMTCQMRLEISEAEQNLRYTMSVSCGSEGFGQENNYVVEGDQLLLDNVAVGSISDTQIVVENAAIGADHYTFKIVSNGNGTANFSDTYIYQDNFSESLSGLLNQDPPAPTLRLALKNQR